MCKALLDGLDAETGKLLQGSQGLSVRDYFAAQALAGWMATFGRSDAAEDVVGNRVTNAADMCYRLADAMLERRKT